MINAIRSKELPFGHLVPSANAVRGVVDAAFASGRAVRCERPAGFERAKSWDLNSIHVVCADRRAFEVGGRLYVRDLGRGGERWHDCGPMPLF